MNTLENVYCLGCKTRHEKVVISEINTIQVRGSTRHQAKGVCPEGKTWTKILKASEIPAMQDVVQETIEVESVKEEPLSETPSNEVVEEEKETTVDVFERAKQEAQMVEVSEPQMVEAIPPIEEERSISVETVKEDIQIEQPQIQIEDVTKEEEDEEEDGGEIHTLHTTYPRPRKRVELRQPLRPPPKKETPLPSPQVEKQNQQRAYRIGFEIGGRVAEEEGIEFGHFIEECWEDTRIPQQYSEDFVQGYLAGGMQVVEESIGTESPDEMPSNNMKPTTVAGIAGLGIFGAWLASKLNQGQR